MQIDENGLSAKILSRIGHLFLLKSSYLNRKGNGWYMKRSTTDSFILVPAKITSSQQERNRMAYETVNNRQFYPDFKIKYLCK